MVVGILSIDFDYFINCSSEERAIYFPQGSDEIPEEKLESMWEERYRNYPFIKRLGVIDEYYILKKYLMLLKISKSNIYISESHKYIKRIIDKLSWNMQLKIVNIDFHHDYYHFYRGEDSLNCGNWLRRVVEERPDTKVKWIRREDSQTITLEGEFPFNHTSNIREIFDEQFDYVFICKSPEWSPPHLTGKFNELVSSINAGKTA